MKFLAVALTSVALTGCSQQIKDFIGNYHRGTTVGQVPAFAATKISPGAVFNSGSQVQGQMVLKPTSQRALGTHVDAVLSLNQQ